MALIEHYKNYEIWESDGHGKAVAGTKRTSSIQVRDYKGASRGYFLVKQVKFTVGNNESRGSAITKARLHIDRHEKLV